MAPAEPRVAPRRSTCPRPSRWSPSSCAKRIAAGEWVVDLRDRTAYAADHLAGTVGFELGDPVRHLRSAG